MTRFHKFFAASLLTLVVSTSALAGEMDFPVTSRAGEMDFPVTSSTPPASVDTTSEVLIFVLENLLPVF
ncbi:MAG TPA: hypothetical protein VM866_03745 [Pyrinomonadaceae bacterium]|jgi:hypothetical protein|nr:hypothetical protein [Pyrinomonadaceae bacterium]